MNGGLDVAAAGCLDIHFCLFGRSPAAFGSQPTEAGHFWLVGLAFAINLLDLAGFCHEQFLF